MPYTADPMAHKATVDTTKAGAPVANATFGATGAQVDSGMPTGGARTVTGLSETGSEACVAVRSDPATLTSARDTYRAFVDARTPRSLAH